MNRPALTAALCAVVLLPTACGSDPVDDVAAATTTAPVTSPTTVTTTSAPTTAAATTRPVTTTTKEASAGSTPKTLTASKTPTASATPSPKDTKASPTRLSVVAKRGPQPTERFPQNDPAVGTGANARVGPVPDPVWDRMVGYSWTKGCPVGRSGLRYVTVNFWGFDGQRSRGALVVGSRIADRTARAFEDLYGQYFRIRQMRVMDRSWGHNPKGPGADDYAAMEADNTSAFNCRYVGGQEERKVWSNHAYGLAIDVNDFENPYVADDGTVYPDRYWLDRRGSAAGVFSSRSSRSVTAFTSRGLRWGGLWSHPDLQHFDVSR